MPLRILLLLAAVLPVCVAQTTSLQLSATSLSFTANTGSEAPPPQWITLNTADGTPAQISVRADGGDVSTPAPGWLSLRPLTVTAPGRVRVAVDASALQSGSYSARLLITDSQGRALAAPIPVSLNVATRTAQLRFSPEFIRLSALVSTSSVSAPLIVTSMGPADLGTVSASIASPTPWLRVTANPCGGRECVIRVLAALTGLAAGTYQGSVRVVTGLGSRDIPVSLLIRDRVPVLSIFPEGLGFEARQGTTLAMTKTVTVRNSGDGVFSWSVDLSNARWLAVAITSDAVVPDIPGTLTVIANPTGLAAGNYSTILNLRSGGGNLALPVRLRVTAAGSPATLDLNPAGLLIKTTSGAEAPVRPVTVLSTTSDTINYQAAAQVNDAAGTPWLSVTPSRGTIPDRDRLAAAVSVNIAATPLSLRQGAYTGEVVFAPGSADSTALNVAVAVLPGGQADCVPQNLALVHTGLPNNFRLRVGTPVPVTVQFLDDCGTIPDAVVGVLFSNGESLTLANQGGGVWGATWVPRTPSAAMTVTARAFTDRLPAATAEVSGTVLADTQPVLYQGGVLDNLNAIRGGALAPGAIVQIFGANLSAGTSQASFSGGRLPTTLGGATVTVGGIDAPLYFTSPGQINAQIPYELEAGKQYPLVVSSRGDVTNAEVVTIAQVQPGIAAFSDGRAIAQTSDFQLIGPDRPAHPGEYAVIYLTGLGATSPAVATGAQAPVSPLAQAARVPELLIDRRPAELLFAGLTPGFAGLYQINFRISPSQAAGDWTMVVVQGSARSNEVTLPVR